MAQCKKQKVKDWLQSGKPLTALMAAQLFGCVNLSGIILQLRKEGMAIVTENRINNNGERYAQYITSK